LKPKVLFLVNRIYLDKSLNEGGVRNCTEEYIKLLSTRFDVILFPVDYTESLLYRIRIKLGLNIYNDYKPDTYKEQLYHEIQKNEINYVFLNLANTMTFAPMIKNKFNHSVKIILCSHGNESGDFLHHSFRFKQQQNWIQGIINPLLFARMIDREVTFRLLYLDMVLTISEVEEGVEKWLGAKNVFMVPRVLNHEPVPWNPVPGRVGFLGDLSHKPNYEGIVAFCDAIVESGSQSLKLRVLGNPAHIGNKLAEKYFFVEYCGFVPNNKITEEVGSWSLFLNLVFYYSRGVSTKLAKGLNWGLPVLTSNFGNRGYAFVENKLITVNTPREMASVCINLVSNKKELTRLRDISIKLCSENGEFKPIMDSLLPILISL
jgi:hypothetical protein